MPVIGADKVMNTALLVFASLAALVGSMICTAHDLTASSEETEQSRTIHLDGFSGWLKARFSEAELEGFQPQDLRVEAYSCGCYDKPNKHFPYLIVLLRTPKGDLVTRPEPRESEVSFTALAVRYGTQYCDAEADETCYGSFAEICEFTDFKYGPYLAAFFPTCKADQLESVLTDPEDTASGSGNVGVARPLSSVQ